MKLVKLSNKSFVNPSKIQCIEFDYETNSICAFIGNIRIDISHPSEAEFTIAKERILKEIENV